MTAVIYQVKVHIIAFISYLSHQSCIIPIYYTISYKLMIPLSRREYRTVWSSYLRFNGPYISAHNCSGTCYMVCMMRTHINNSGYLRTRYPYHTSTMKLLLPSPPERDPVRTPSMVRRELSTSTYEYLPAATAVPCAMWRTQTVSLETVERLNGYETRRTHIPVFSV